MLRHPTAEGYEQKRTSNLLKVKRWRDLDARIVGHEEGKGKHAGRLGALVCELEDGTRFNVGTGFSDAQRAQPPRIGEYVRVKFFELTDGGVPRFPVFDGELLERNP
jgi:DNA ligase-1